METIQLAVDGEAFAQEKISFSVNGQTYGLDEVGKITNAEWFFTDPATLTVSKPNGLAMGMHTVQLGIVFRKSYWPKNDPENLYGFLKGTDTLNQTFHEVETAAKRFSLV